jgi:hypothetical protein
MRLTLTRIERGRNCTIGRLEVDGSYFCWSLEDVVRPHGMKVPGMTAIPAGTYRVQITYSPRFKVWMPILIGVPNFTGVRIHPGNVAEDTEGCILVGYDRDGDSIGRSRLAYQDLYRQISEALETAEDVYIDIENRFEEA